MGWRGARRPSALTMTVGVTLAVGSLVGCGADDPGPRAQPDPSPSATSPATGSPSVTPSPSDSPTGTVAPGTTPWQRVTVRAVAHANGTVSVTYTVRGVSSMYDVWGSSGGPTDAGPRRTRVYVDGREAGGSDGGAIACRTGNPLQRYAMHWPWYRLSVPLAPGTHQIVVRAPYCADGRLAPSVDRVLVVSR